MPRLERRLLTSLLTACGACRDQPALQRIWERARPEADCHLYSAYIYGLGACGFAGEAEEQYQEMLLRGVQPNHVTLTALLEGPPDSSRVLRTFQRMAWLRIAPDSRVVARAVAACADRPDVAVKLVHALPRAKLKVSADVWTSLLSVHTRNRDWDGCSRCLAEMQKLGATLGPAQSSLLIQACKDQTQGEGDDWEVLAEVTFRQAVVNGHAVNGHLFSCLMELYAKNGSTVKAHRLDRERR
eukprot:Hpha_TRINITY_DN26524_c0_g1::TRINITY_DN26524_c0_g1_i1::g.112953::m.112953